MSVSARVTSRPRRSARRISWSTCCSRERRRGTAREIAEVVDSTGGDMNAYTTKEYTAFYAARAGRHLDLGVELLCDVVTAPAFRGPEFESERQVILEELHLQQDEPDDLVHTVLYESLFPEHPLGWEIVGHERSIKAMTPRSVRAFHRRWYVPSNMVFAAAGPVDHGDFAAAVAGASVRSRRATTPRRRRPRASPAPASHRAPAPASPRTCRSDGARVDHFDPDRYRAGARQPGHRRRHVEPACSRRSARTTGSRIRSSRRRPASATPACSRSTSGRRPTARRSSCATPVTSSTTSSRNGVTDRELEVAKNAFEGATRDEPRGHRVAHGPSRHVGDHPRVGDAARSLSQLGARGVAARHAACRGEDLRRRADGRRRRARRRSRRSLVPIGSPKCDVRQLRWCGRRASIRVRS